VTEIPFLGRLLVTSQAALLSAMNGFLLRDRTTAGNPEKAHLDNFRQPGARSGISEGELESSIRLKFLYLRERGVIPQASVFQPTEGSPA
jgi:hypothetical protein